MPEPVADSSTKHPVLVVDDDVLIRTLMADLLREAGLAVIECGDAHEALDVLQSGTVVALLFSDIQMPGSINGVGLAKVVRADYPGLKIVLTSSERLPSGADCDAFFPKPWDFDRVIGRVKSLLSG